MESYCVLSDVHANAAALKAVKEDCGKVDHLWFLGDLFDRGNQGPQTYKQFEYWYERFPEGNRVWLAGNHDRAFAWVHNSQAYPEWSYYFSSLDPRLKQTSEQRARGVDSSYVQATAMRTGQQSVRIGSLLAYLTHGFPVEKEPNRLVEYDLDHSPGKEAQSYRRFHEVTGGANLWVVGHSHCQSGWLYRDSHSREETGWSELIHNFGTTLHGDPRGGEATAEVEVNMAELGPNSFLIINPGSVGSPRDSLNGHLVAKYIKLEASENRLTVRFCCVRY